MKKVLFFFQQVGGFNALEPLLERIAGRCETTVIARDCVAQRIRNKGHAVMNMDKAGLSPDDPAGADRMIDGLSPDIVITDTIYLTRTESGPVTRQVWKSAARRDIPSIAYVDCWWGFRERFQMPGEEVSPVMPDRIAVVDDIAREMMLDLSFAAGKVFVAGNPRFSELAVMGRDPVLHAQARSRQGIKGDDTLVAFVSQPIIGGADEWGFTQKTILSSLNHILMGMPTSLRDKIVLNIMVHPEDSEDDLADAVADSRLRTRFSRDSSSLDILLSSTLVTGIFSILLTEAVVMGKPVLSLQFGLRREDMLITNRVGATVPLRDLSDRSEIMTAVTDPGYRDVLLERQKSFTFVGDSMSRWEDLIMNEAGR